MFSSSWLRLEYTGESSQQGWDIRSGCYWLLNARAGGSDVHSDRHACRSVEERRRTGQQLTAVRYPRVPRLDLTMYDGEDLPKAKPVVGWPGGKGRLLKYIRPLITDHDLYCEVFVGGGAVLIDKAPSPLEIINDINSDLISFYRQVQFNVDSVLDEMDLVMNSRREFRDYLSQRGLTEIQRAARWYITNKLSFGGMGRTFGINRTTSTGIMGSRAQREFAIRAPNRRFDKVCIEELPWEKCLETYDAERTLFFLDPPYLDAGGSTYAGWSEHELTRFCQTVLKLEGKWIFKFQDCQQVRDLMSGFVVTGIERANGIGNATGKTGRNYREVIISSQQPVRVGGRKGKSA